MLGKVYFFHNGTECKIGYTVPFLKQRLWAANVWSPYALNILGWITSEFPDQLEKEIHLELAHLRIIKPSGNGEWFDLTIDEVTEIISRYKQHGKLKHYNYSTAKGHPAHFIRSVWGGQQNETGHEGQGLPISKRRLSYSCDQRIQHAERAKYGVGGEAFLRQTGA